LVAGATRARFEIARIYQKQTQDLVLEHIIYNKHSFKMQEETKEKIMKVIDIGKTIIHYGFIPFVLYLGITRSNPRPSLIRLVSPLA